MSLNSLFYDDCHCQLRLEDSRSILDYDIFVPKFENCCNCRQNNKEVDRQRLGSRVDIESELRSLYRPNSNCPNRKYYPCPIDKNQCDPYYTLNHTVCDRDTVLPIYQGLNRNYDTTYYRDIDTCSMNKAKQMNQK